jgi:tetratricopeptide (TPR) repeat protein
MRRYLGPTLAVILLCFFAAAQRPDNRLRSAYGSVRVTVKFAHGQPVKSGVKVELLDARGLPVSTGITNDKGEAALFGVPTGQQYLLQVRGEGITTFKRWIRLDTLETDQTQDVEVTPGNGNDEPTPGVAVVDADVPSKARKELEKGNSLAEHSQWADAAEHYQKAIESYPKYATAYNNLGSARMNLQDAAGAKDAFQHAVAINDKYASAWMNLARVQHASGDVQGAEQSLLKAVAAEPTNVQALTNLAQIELQLQKFDATEDLAHKVNALPHQGYALVHVLAAYAYQQQNKPTEALAEYKLYLQEDPKGAMAEKVRASVATLEQQKTTP